MALRKTPKVAQEPHEIPQEFAKRQDSEELADIVQNDGIIDENSEETDVIEEKVEEIATKYPSLSVNDIVAGDITGHTTSITDAQISASEPVTAASTLHTSSDTFTSDPNEIPQEFAVRNFEAEQTVIRRKVAEVVSLIELGEVDSKSIARVVSVVEKYQDIDFDEEYDMRDELHTMMKMVRAVRESILTHDHQIASSTTVTEVKSVLDASMRLVQLLTKSNKEIINMDRIRAVEAAFLEVISEMPTEQQKRYVDHLEHRMKLMKELSQLSD